VTRAASPQTENRIGLTIDFQILTIVLQDVTAGPDPDRILHRNTGKPVFIHKIKSKKFYLNYLKKRKKNMIFLKIFADSTCITKTEVYMFMLLAGFIRTRNKNFF